MIFMQRNLFVLTKPIVILSVCRFEEMLGKATQILDSSHEDDKTPVRVPDRRRLQLGEVKVEPHTDTNDTCDTSIQVCA